MEFVLLYMGLGRVEHGTRSVHRVAYVCGMSYCGRKDCGHEMSHVEHGTRPDAHGTKSCHT